MKIKLNILTVVLISFVGINVANARSGEVAGKYMPVIEAGENQLAQADVAGFVIAVRGQVTATNTKGVERVLTRRAKFFSNEVIKTGEKSMAQLRFKDRALMRLRPKSELKIAEYH